jgi:hypothetical protein
VAGAKEETDEAGHGSYREAIRHPGRHDQGCHIAGDIRAMIVVGPPGVGKSYGVEYQLEKAGMFDQISGRKIKYQVIKGAMTPIGLYCTLYKNSDPRNVLVFDDCDSVCSRMTWH